MTERIYTLLQSDALQWLTGDWKPLGDRWRGVHGLQRYYPELIEESRGEQTGGGSRLRLFRLTAAGLAEQERLK
jgi:hypothetical protein